MALGIAGLIAVICAVSWQVFGRYVLNNTPTWAESLALLLVLYVTMLGVAVGVRESSHIGLEFLLQQLPPRLSRLLKILIHGLTLLFGALMAYGCASLSASVWDYGLPTLGISEGWKYVPATLAGGLIVLFSIEHLIALIGGRQARLAQECGREPLGAAPVVLCDPAPDVAPQGLSPRS